MSAAEQVSGTAVALTAPTDHEIDSIRRRAAATIAARQEIAKIEKQIAGLTWGSGPTIVQGASLSPMTRAVFAEFCYLTRANPMYHVDILGSRPYLNANYWADLINTRPEFHHYEQRDISPSVEHALRERAQRHRAIAAQLQGDEARQRILRALELEDEADDIALSRAQWGAPEWAQCVVQTTIWRFIDAAPLDAIRAGRISDISQYVVSVSECNWAGGRPPARKRDGSEFNADPIGNAEPAKTARTRSLRRAAVKAFATWMQAYEQQIAKAEQAIEAEFEVVRADRARELVPGVVTIGAGEPAAAANGSNGVKPLPVEDATAAPADASAQEFDRNAARRSLFATLRDAGIETDAARKEWARGNGLPESTKDWTAEQFARAIELLVAPVKQKALVAATVFGMPADAVAQKVFGKGFDELTLAEYREMARDLSAMVDGRAADDAGQQRML